jgi:uncharacterized protein YqeY
VNLADKIRADLSRVLKERQTVKAGALRMLLASIRNAEIEKRASLTDADLLQQVRREIKLRREAMEAAAEGSRDKIRAEEEMKLQLMESYLPQQLSDSELAVLVTEAIREAGAGIPSDVGKVMKILMPRIAGRAEGRRASSLVSQRLSQGS